MPVEHATLEEALSNGIDLGSNAFLLIHGWAAGPLLLDFVAKVKAPLSAGAKTAAQLAAAISVEEGPLSIMLRTCSILGYVAFNPAEDTYTVVPGPDLEELEALLGPEAPTAKAVRSIYTEAVPPFKLPSPQASCCFEVWASCRPTWQNSKSKALAVLLDGVVLSPLLTSITYFARWNEEGLDRGKDNSMDSFDFGELDAASRATLSGMFQELGVGSLSAAGALTMTPKASLALQRCYSYYVPTSYSPLLAHFGRILAEEPGWGFATSVEGEREVHVQRTLNVVGSGAQHQTLFKDMMRHINDIFGGEDFEKQPKFVADTGCGDGHLLIHIYEHVKKNLPRGQVLDQYPLTMIGIDFNEESRMATAVNMANKEIPNVVQKGDIGKPAEIMSALKKLKKKKIDLSTVLHVRSFLDHDRSYLPPANAPAEDSVMAAFARAQMADFVHLDKHGKPIKALEAFASLVEHFERWGDALVGSYGLCLLEVMMLDVPTTRRFLNDCVSFHFDVLQCLSRQYMISPAAFVMGAAMAGLLPKSIDNVQTYPEQGKYCRVLNQHLVRKPFKIRFAELADLPRLVRLEEIGWSEHMRASEEVLKRRLETSPTTCLACEIEGKVIAVVYMQRVGSLDIVDTQKFMQISDAHDPAGRILQLVSIISDNDPEVKKHRVGFELRNFALHLARVDPGLDSVIGVTRCSSFSGSAEQMQAYVDSHVAGKESDSTVGFHTDSGAKVLKLVPGFRPEDTANSGIGVLIQYQVKDIVAKSQAAPSVRARVTSSSGGASAAAPAEEVLALDALSGIMNEIGYPLEMDNLGRGFFSYGLDSLEMVRIRNRLSSMLDMELSKTLLLDYPNVEDLAQHLDEERCVGKFKSLKPKDEPKSVWETIAVPQLLFVLQKLNKLYALPQHQSKLQEARQKAGGEESKFLSLIESTIVEVEGPVLAAEEIIADKKPGTVVKAHTELEKCFRRHAAKNTEIGKGLQELERLMRAEQ